MAEKSFTFTDEELFVLLAALLEFQHHLLKRSEQLHQEGDSQRASSELGFLKQAEALSDKLHGIRYGEN